MYVIVFVSNFSLTNWRDMDRTLSRIANEFDVVALILNWKQSSALCYCQTPSSAENFNVQQQITYN